MSDDVRYSEFAVGLQVFTPPFLSTDIIILTRGGVDYQVPPTAFMSQSAYGYAQPATGDTYFAPEGTRAVILDPSAAIAVMNVTLPPSPGDGDVFEASTTQDITSLLASAAGTSVIVGGSRGTLARNSGMSWRYNLALDTWFPRS